MGSEVVLAFSAPHRYAVETAVTVSSSLCQFLAKGRRLRLAHQQFENRFPKSIRPLISRFASDLPR